MGVMIIPEGLEGPPGKWQTKFHEYLRDNPAVLAMILEMVEKDYAEGKRWVTMAGYFDRLRDLHVKTNGQGGYLVNDRWNSRYVRLVIRMHPEWADMFELRTSDQRLWES